MIGMPPATRRSPNMVDVSSLTAVQLITAYQSLTLSPVEVIEAAFERVGRVNPVINAFYWLNRDDALDAARQSERRWMRGEPCGLLDGVPTSVKDALPYRGSHGFRGSVAYGEFREPDTTDAPSVARMREHGAIVLGKTTMCDFGILASGYSSKHGITRNPLAPARNCGGSTSGGAASVAAGINPIVIGTDIVGSIRLPASFCGLFGLKPSQGRVPYYFPNSPALVAGPLSRNVEDAALLLDVIAEPDARDFTALPPADRSFRDGLRWREGKVRFGLVTDLGFEPKPDSEVTAAVEEAARRFQNAGHDVVTVKADFNQADLRAAEDFYRARCFTELMMCQENDRDRADVIGNWTEPAKTMTARDLYAAFNALMAMRQRAMHLMRNVDFLLLPSVACAPYDANLPGLDDERIFEPWAYTFLFNLTEQPASSIPCGRFSDGLPIGLQIVGQRFDDAGVLEVSRLFETLRGPFPPSEMCLEQSLELL